MINAIVLAAGKSTRFKSEKSKVIHNLIDKPVILYISNALDQAGVTNKVLVVNKNSKDIKEIVKNKFTFALQEEQLGTAHAVGCATSLVGLKGETLIVVGDCPLIKANTLKNLIDKNKDYDLTVLTAIVEPPNSYGKIVRNKLNQIEKIVEDKFCSYAEKNIKEINTGIFCIKNETLWKFLPYINNTNSEKMLTDIVELLVRNKRKVNTVSVENFQECTGINTREDFINVHSYLSQEIINNHIQNGVTILHPQTVTIGSDVVIESDVIIYPNNFIIGNSLIKKGSIIYPNSYIIDSQIGENVVVECSKIENSKVQKNSNIGPFANIKKNAVIGDGCRIGAFVEVKNSQLGSNVKSAHLTYLGDSEIESNVNIGCGVVTVNYDGAKKHKTRILENSFIGSNVNLIAPITVGKNCVVAAGSTLTESVSDGDLAIARSYQVNKEKYGEKYLDKIKNSKE